MRYDKLVRDKIPAIIKRIDKTPSVHKAGRNEYFKKLKEKLVEEAKEYSESCDMEELVDVIEVVYAIASLKGVSKRHLESLRSEKAKKRGAFRNRLILDEVT